VPRPTPALALLAPVGWGDLRVLAPRLGLGGLGGLLALALASGCAGRSALVAEDGSHRLTARDSESGVTVVLTSGVWEGQPSELPEQWTVLHVLVANLGTEPVLLAPGDLELRDERGFRYELYDPGAVFALVEPGSSADAYAREYRRDYDPGGPVEFEPIVAPGDVPAEALPWGVLEPGTQMRGFVYFESVESSANSAMLKWHFTRPDHAPLVDLQFPLWVSRPSRRG
jgi:hypothetical protein